jgi:hypothetical protein
MTTTPLTDQQLAEYERLIADTTPLGAATASPGMATALLAEVRRLREAAAGLEDDAALLSALQAAGVDNWEGYDDALERL